MKDQNDQLTNFETLERRREKPKITSSSNA